MTNPPEDHATTAGASGSQSEPGLEDRAYYLRMADWIILNPTFSGRGLTELGDGILTPDRFVREMYDALRALVEIAFGEIVKAEASKRDEHTESDPEDPMLFASVLTMIVTIANPSGPLLDRVDDLIAAMENHDGERTQFKLYDARLRLRELAARSVIALVLEQLTKAHEAEEGTE